jgi:hypothetical protein
MTSPKLQMLRNYRDKIYIMILICSKSAGYYGSINNRITGFLILISTALTILNGVLQLGSIELKYVNIVCNALMALTIGFNRAFKFGEKSSDFHKHSLNFTKLEHTLENEYNLNKNVSDEFIKNIVDMYDTYLDSLHFSVPGNIINNVKKEVGENYEFPLSIGGKPSDLKTIQIVKTRGEPPAMPSLPQTLPSLPQTIAQTLPQNYMKSDFVFPQ